MFGDSVMWGILGGIVFSVVQGKYCFVVVLYYAMLLCVYNFWIDKNAIYAPSSSGIFIYFCLGVFVIFVMAECSIWFCLYNPDYTRGMSPDLRLLWESERIDYEAMIPYARLNMFFIAWVIAFFVAFIATFFVIKLSLFIYKKLCKNSDEILCNFHKGKAMVFGIFAFITMIPLLYLVSNIEALNNVGEYLSRLLP